MNKIKQLLKEKGMTQKDLAAKLGMSEVAVSNIVKNNSSTKETLQKIADILETDVDELTKDKLLVRYSGEIDLGGVIIPCYVLNNGMRVISSRKMQEALKMVDADEGKLGSGATLTRILTQKTLNPFITKYIDVVNFKPIICYDKGNIIHGYRATDLADICDCFLEARKSIKLSPRQTIIAEQCEILMRSFARVGIIALVDEATGYDKAKEKAKSELQKFLTQFIREEAAKWVKTFNDQFFEDIYKMRKWTWSDTSKRPGVVGTWIKDIVYDRLAPVLPSLENLNPKDERGNRRYKHHQFLTDDIGIPKLKQHLEAIHAIAILADYDWYRFNAFLDKAYPRKYKELYLDFED